VRSTDWALSLSSERSEAHYPLLLHEIFHFFFVPSVASLCESSLTNPRRGLILSYLLNWQPSEGAWRSTVYLATQMKLLWSIPGALQGSKLWWCWVLLLVAPDTSFCSTSARYLLSDDNCAFHRAHLPIKCIVSVACIPSPKWITLPLIFNVLRFRGLSISSPGSSWVAYCPPLSLPVIFCALQLSCPLKFTILVYPRH